MSKIKKSQILILSVLTALLLITPVLSSSSIRPKYLYFIINLLIIAVGAEAGLLSCLFSIPKLTPPPDQSNYKAVVSVPNEMSSPLGICPSASTSPVVNKIVERVMGRRPSTPSLFFIGSPPEDREELDDINGQELFTKSETFIGNFYKQLKIQREEPWNNHIAF